ncbi:hypothetical protein BOTU111922_16265 [Bordetella tumulicola]
MLPAAGSLNYQLSVIVIVSDQQQGRIDDDKLYA